MSKELHTNLLDIRNLRVEYITDEGIVTAVENLNLRLKKGETLGLVGETGAGKTTTALAMMRLVPDPPGRVTEGEILFHGEDLLTKNWIKSELYAGTRSR